MQSINKKMRISSTISLHKRIIFLFLLLAAVAGASITFVSNYTISRIIDNKLAGEYKNSLIQKRISFENIISNLNYVSQQLAFYDETKQMIEQYFTVKDPYERSILLGKIYGSVRSITFTNPNIGLCYYYFKEKNEIFFNNLPLSKDKNPFISDNILYKTNSFTYLGPYRSQGSFSSNTVFAMYCKVDSFDFGDVYFYVESNYNTFEDLFKADNTGDSSLLVMDQDNRITYSEIPEVFPVGSIIPMGSNIPMGSSTSMGSNIQKQEEGRIKLGNYYCFMETTKQGFHLATVVDINLYNHERIQWYQSVFLLAVFLVILSMVLATILYRTVYHPLHQFDKQLDHLLFDNNAVTSGRINIPEYDYLLDRFGETQTQLKEMIGQIVKQEQYRSKLEIDKLRYQINPHFLVNTLNTVHWLAVMNHQEDIDGIIQSLSHLLAYNLDKGVKTANIEHELTAISEYIRLQQSRYDFTYKVIREPEDAEFPYPCPKFILQPLVENALSHGFRDHMTLTVTLTQTDCITISVKDDGTGMTKEQLHRLEQYIKGDIKDSNKQNGFRLGIGLEYVIQSLRVFYQNDFSLTVSSEPGSNTVFTLTLPFTPKNGSDAEESELPA